MAETIIGLFKTEVINRPGRGRPMIKLNGRKLCNGWTGSTKSACLSRSA